MLKHLRLNDKIIYKNNIVTIKRLTRDDEGYVTSIKGIIDYCAVDVSIPKSKIEEIRIYND